MLPSFVSKQSASVHPSSKDFFRQKYIVSFIESSNVFYFDILDLPADSTDTIQQCLHMLNESVRIARRPSHTPGSSGGRQDIPTSSNLKLKRSYGPELDWIVLSQETGMSWKTIIQCY